jgi:hypothetical protein
LFALKLFNIFPITSLRLGQATASEDLKAKTCWGSYVPGAKVRLDAKCSGSPAASQGVLMVVASKEMVLAGEIEDVARCCETDVVNTRGSITAEQLA